MYLAWMTGRVRGEVLLPRNGGGRMRLDYFNRDSAGCRPEYHLRILIRRLRLLFSLAIQAPEMPLATRLPPMQRWIG